MPESLASALGQHLPHASRQTPSPKEKLIRKAAPLTGIVAALACSAGLIAASPASAENLDLIAGTTSDEVMDATTEAVSDDETSLVGHIRSEPSDQDVADAITDYWTDERLASAVPVEELCPELTNGSAEEPTAEFSTGLDLGREMQGDKYKNKTIAHPSRPTYNIKDRKWNRKSKWVNGKIFFKRPGKLIRGRCSASAINSESKRLIITAAHCVHDFKSGKRYQNIVFIPGYHKWQKPVDKFAVKSSRVFTTYTTYAQKSNGNLRARGMNVDISIAVTYKDKKGRRLVNLVGSHGVKLGGNDFTRDVMIKGYPMNRAWGWQQRACKDNTSKHRWYDRRADKTYKFYKVQGCDFGGGASGGPWLTKYNESTGRGYVRSVSSFGPKKNTNYLAGPRFPSGLKTMYEKADKAGQ